MATSKKKLWEAELELAKAGGLHEEYPAYSSGKYFFSKGTDQLSKRQRLKLIRDVYRTVVVATESLAFGNLGMDLAYLMGAIAENETYVGGRQSLLLRIICFHYDPVSSIFDFIVEETQ